MLLHPRWAAESSASPQNPAYTAERGRSPPQLAQEASSGHKQVEWLSAAESASVCRRLQEQVGAGNTSALPGELTYC